MKCIRVNEPEKFDSLIAESLSQSDSVFVLFFGREVPSTGNSWCPDCVIADPKVRKAIGSVENSILLEVPVDRKTDTASKTNIFRERKDIKLGRIPTLLRWTSAGPAATRLVEDECNEADISKYVELTKNRV
ncbi:hypothetical protein GGI07_005765 [Coemansia sp. Benny D115]|nr:hypothetical protein GGI07_005765 [Coemansia sp. Benny D115]